MSDVLCNWMQLEMDCHLKTGEEHSCCRCGAYYKIVDGHYTLYMFGEHTCRYHLRNIADSLIYNERFTANQHDPIQLYYVDQPRWIRCGYCNRDIQPDTQKCDAWLVCSCTDVTDKYSVNCTTCCTQIRNCAYHACESVRGTNTCTLCDAVYNIGIVHTCTVRRGRLLAENSTSTD
jgi:hypothetical protein